MRGDSETDTTFLQLMAAEAKAFVGAFDWCKGVREVYFGCGIGGVIGASLFNVVPSTTEVDQLLWVIVGDVPPAYLVTDESPTPASALRAYVHEMRHWVAAAEAGESVDDLIPVNVAPTEEHALALKKRLDYIEREIIPTCT